jgi:hypothetical protein
MPSKDELQILLDEAKARIEQLERERTSHLGPGTPVDYVYREYPKMVYKGPVGSARLVANPDEEAKLGPGWSTTPDEETAPARPDVEATIDRRHSGAR